MINYQVDKKQKIYTQENSFIVLRQNRINFRFFFTKSKTTKIKPIIVVPLILHSK